MTNRRSRIATVVVLETLEGRVALSTSAHLVHGLAVVHMSQHKAPAIPNPILVNLTPRQAGIVLTDVTYNAKYHLITIKGNVDMLSSVSSNPYGSYVPSYPTTVYVSASLNQAVNRFASVGGSQSTTVTVTDATVKTVPFRLRMVASAGQFGRGTAVLSISDSSYYPNSTINAIVRLRNSNSY